MLLLDDDRICNLIRHAWQESQPGTNGAHEEGGFVVRDTDGSLRVERWPTGAQNEILVPPHPAGKRDHRVIVLTFHTHPNPGVEFQQEPSLTDIRAVCNDPHLAHPEYEGEIVIAAESIYLIRRTGEVEVIGDTNAVLKIP